MTSIIKLRLVRTCRTCAELTNEKDLMPLFEGASSCKRSREEIFEEIFSFNLGINPNDKLPQQICRKCVQAIESGIEFRKQCKAVQAKLRDDFLHSNPSNDKGFPVVRQEVKIQIGSEQHNVIDRTVPFYESESNKEYSMVKTKHKDTLDSLRSNESFLTIPEQEVNIQSDNEEEDRRIDEMMKCEVSLEEINEQVQCGILDSQHSNENGFTNLEDPDHYDQFNDESHFDESSIQMKCEVSEDETDNWECEYYIEHDFEKDEYATFNMQSSVRNKSKRLISASLESTGIEDTDSKNWNNSDFVKEHSVDSSTKDEKYNSEIESCLLDLLEKSDLENEDEDERKPEKRKFSPEGDNEEDCTKIKNKVKKRSVQRPPIRDLTKKYICKYCDKNFSWAIQLNKHILECELRTCVSCNFCTVEFETEDLLEKHTDEFHPNGGPPMCPICSKTFLNNAKRNLHMRQVHTRQDQSKCDICGKVFKSKMNLSNHKQRFHVATTKIYKCEICNKKFLTDASYKFHLKIHDDGSNKFNCTYCNKATMSLNKLKQHETIHTGERPFLCDICGLAFRYKPDYNKHFITHSDGIEHKCEECMIGFPTRRRYLDHMKKHHKESRVQCDLCDKSFRRQELATHQYAAHNGPKPLTKAATKSYPFRCPICAKGFDVAFSLIQHARIHSLERKHACTYCTSRYKRADHLQLHIKRMHLNIKDHACEVCGKKYLEKCSLKAHMIVHQNIKPFKCPNCPWEFKTKRCLQNHMTRHTGEKRFICNICNMCFTNRRLLIIHTETHSDDQRQAIENEVRMEVENDTSTLPMQVCKTDYDDMDNVDLASELFLDVEELTTISERRKN